MGEEGVGDVGLEHGEEVGRKGRETGKNTRKTRTIGCRSNRKKMES